MRLLITITFVFAFIILSNAQENKRFFTFKSISEVDFKTAYNNNYNAKFVTEIEDSTKLEKAFESIAKTYSRWEKEFAESELCSSPRCLTSFEAYYPNLNLYLFYILNYHYENACFVFANTNEMASGYQRYRASYGVMSKDGLWVGLERQDCDSFLQLEICKTSKRGVWTILRFDLTDIDINEYERGKNIPVMFWANKNTIYISAIEYDGNNKQVSNFYSITFDY